MHLFKAAGMLHLLVTFENMAANIIFLVYLRPKFMMNYYTTHHILNANKGNTMRHIKKCGKLEITNKIPPPCN
jgi:hypothetical protein